MQKQQVSFASQAKNQRYKKQVGKRGAASSTQVDQSATRNVKDTRTSVKGKPYSKAASNLEA